jgi:hypothetical protein
LLARTEPVLSTRDKKGLPEYVPPREMQVEAVKV